MRCNSGLTKQITVLALVLGLALSLPTLLFGDVVSGTIFGPDEKPLVNLTFTAKDSKGQMVNFKSDKSGNFSIYLDPGRYTVTYSGDATVEGVIESYPQPVQKDVHLKKKA